MSVRRGGPGVALLDSSLQALVGKATSAAGLAGLEPAAVRGPAGSDHRAKPALLRR